MTLRVRVPPRFLAATMDSLDPIQFGKVDQYAEKLLTNVKEGNGLILCGPSGVGKSWALAALTRYYAEFAASTGRRSWDYEFVTAPVFFENMSVAKEDPSFVDARRNQPWSVTYQTVKWLVINDLGKEYRGGKLDSQIAFKLGRVLRHRSENQLPTHISTNLQPKGEEESVNAVYGPSITSLIRETMCVMKISGQDLRKPKKMLEGAST